jgi:LPXTG-site transpeptidase (sortase) family protein
VSSPALALARRFRRQTGPAGEDGTNGSGNQDVAAANGAEASEVAAAGKAARLDGAFVGLGITATTVGLCLLLFFAYVYAFSGFQEARQQHALLNEYNTSQRAQLLSGKDLAAGQPAGILQIPDLGLKQVVVRGSTASDLLLGPGLMPGTAQPGSLGNAVIAGHRSIAGAPFANLYRLRAGDHVIVTTVQGRFVYQVDRVGQARPGAPDPISPNRHPELTLVTSSPSLSGGRLYVVAKLLSTPVRVAIPRRPPSVAERGLHGDSSADLPAILLGLLLGVVLLGTFLAYRKWRDNRWSIYLLTTPVAVAAALLWYAQLIRLLPGTM